MRVLATSQGGSEHILVGRVEGKTSVPFASKSDARTHLEKNGWKDIRFAVDSTNVDDQIRITWDNQSITIHRPGESNFVYLRGGPTSGKKVSKSDLNHSH